MASDKRQRRLQELSGSRFELSEGQPDIRGWELRDTNGHKMGKVKELIFDVHARKVRYMVVDILDSKELQLEKRRVMVPIGLAELKRADKDVIIHTVTPFHLRALPKYDSDDLGAKSERAIGMVFGRKFTADGVDSAMTDSNDSFYEHEMFNEDKYHGNQSSSGNAESSTRTDKEAARRRELSEAEAASLRRDAELGKPISNLDALDDRRDGETDEEYQRRRRNRI
jgi:sporulation protein YlmC with PRC-barrel domain